MNPMDNIECMQRTFMIVLVTVGAFNECVLFSKNSDDGLPERWGNLQRHWEQKLLSY